MINKHFRLLLSSMLVFVLSGCAGAKTEAEAQATRVTMVKTGDLALLPKATGFAWHPTMSKVYGADRVNSDAVVKQMQSAITHVMEAKGYHLVNLNQSPGVLVGFGLALESELSDKEILGKAGLVPGLSSIGVDEDKYEKGSVMVALFNPMHQSSIWRVLAQGFTELKPSAQVREQRPQRFQQLMQTMLKPVPDAQM